VTKINSTTCKELKGISDSLRIKGTGTVEWHVFDVFNRHLVIKTRCFYVPDATIRLFSPQTLFQDSQAGRCVIDHLKTTLELPNGGTLEFPFHPCSNLPFMHTSPAEKVGLAQSELPDPSGLQGVFDLVGEENANLTAAQRELLLWHFRLGHAGFGWVQSLMRHRKAEHGMEAYPPILPTSNDKAKSCDKPLCEACLLGKQHRRTAGSSTIRPKPEREAAIRRENLSPGECISLDQYESTVRGRLPHTYGRESQIQRYVGGTIGVDHATGYVFLRNQSTLKAGDTVRSVHEFEREALGHSVSFKSFHADNFPFNSKDFQ
jgi:hypothetical protein